MGTYAIEAAAWSDHLRAEVARYLALSGRSQADLSAEIGKSLNYINKSLKTPGPLSPRFIAALDQSEHFRGVETEFHLARLAETATNSERDTYRAQALACYAERYERLVALVEAQLREAKP